MRVSFVLLACVSCVVTLPAYILPFNNGRGVSWIRRVLDCPSLLYGSHESYRCRQEERRAGQRFPQMTVLELVQEEPGYVRVVEDEHAGTYAIKLPQKFTRDKPECTSSEIYVSELDICVEAADHLVKDTVTDNKPGQEKQKEDEKEVVTILQVGEYEKPKCPSWEIWVPEVGICLDRDPPPPLEPEEWPLKPQRRKKPEY